MSDPQDEAAALALHELCDCTNHVYSDCRMLTPLADALRAAEARGLERAALWHDLQAGAIRSETDTAMIPEPYGFHRETAKAIRSLLPTPGGEQKE